MTAVEEVGGVGAEKKADAGGLAVEVGVIASVDGRLEAEFLGEEGDGRVEIGYVEERGDLFEVCLVGHGFCVGKE